MAYGNPFFLVGSGRSGTTLLRLILTGHSRIEIPPETWFIEDLVKWLPLNQPLSPEDVAQAVNIITDHYRWPDMGIPADQFRELVLALDKPKLVDIISLVYSDHLRRSGKERFGDKTPRYMRIVPELVELYPNAKFIHLIRDGRDVAISMIDLDWNGRCYDPDFVWTSVLRLRESYSHSAIGERILDVKYEDLVSNSEQTVRRICTFLGEDFEAGMLDWNARIADVPVRERPIHSKLNEPLARESLARWRSRLSTVECFVMESCMHRELDLWGYPLRFSHWWWRPFFRASRWLLAIFGPFFGRLASGLRRRNLLPRTIYI